MLEGQVSALSSGKVEPKKCSESVKCSFQSDMYQKEQNSFMLYPRKKFEEISRKKHNT